MSDTRNHGGGSLLNLSSGEPQNNNPVSPQPLIPGMVVRDLSGFIVDWSIHLDSQSRRRAIEIQHIGPNGMLVPKSKARLATPQHSPQEPLRRGHLSAQFSRSAQHGW